MQLGTLWGSSNHSDFIYNIILPTNKTPCFKKLHNAGEIVCFLHHRNILSCTKKNGYERKSVPPNTL